MIFSIKIKNSLFEECSYIEAHSLEAAYSYLAMRYGEDTWLMSKFGFSSIEEGFQLSEVDEIPAGASHFWAPLSARNLSHNSEGYASCIHEDQMFSLGITAKEIYNRVREGNRIDFLTRSHNHNQQTLNPVVGAVKTRGKGVKITFVGGRSVSLTTGHMLPVEPEWIDIADPKSKKQININVRQQTMINAGNVRPGMELMDGVVNSVQALGKINAVRMWTHHPALIKTVEGLSIGTRWHEIAVGWSWFVYDPFIGHEVPLGDPVGWLRPNKIIPKSNSCLATVEEIGSEGRRVSISDLATAYNIRRTLYERPVFIIGGQSVMRSKYEPMYLKKLIEGIEVIGEPITNNYVSKAA